MGKNTVVVVHKQNDILNLLREISKKQDTSVFYEFAKNYGTKKICDIVNSREYRQNSLFSNNDFDNVDMISKNIFNNISNEKYKIVLLNSPYYYTKYALNPQTNSMVEQNISLMYNALVDNKVVDIKKKLTLDELEKFVNSKDIVLLGIKEKLISSESYFFDNLQEVDKTFIANAKDGFVKKSIFPSIKFADNEAITQNIASFENNFPNLKTEMTKANKKMLHNVLKYEVQNQQIYLSSMLEDGQKQFVKLVNEYQSKADKIQKMVEFNQKLLSALGERPKANDYKFEETM